MNRFTKIILFLLFAFLLNGVSNHCFAVQYANGAPYALISEGEQQDNISKPKAPHWPEAEIVSGLQFHHITMTRVQRVQLGQYFLSLKSWILDLADRKSSLSQHQRHLYKTTFSYFCYPVSEYYVFALRRIII